MLALAGSWPLGLLAGSVYLLSNCPLSCSEADPGGQCWPGWLCSAEGGWEGVGSFAHVWVASPLERVSPAKLHRAQEAPGWEARG